MWLDALVVRCRDGAMAMAGVCCMVAVGMNREGRREVLGVELARSEDGAGWTSFCAAWPPGASRACSW